MGYELHVTHADDWLKASAHPVSRADVDKVVQGDPELDWSATDNINGRYDFIEWNSESAFYWETHEIIGKSLIEPQIIKLCEIAEKLGAKVVGDDGEHYKVKRGLFGGKKLTYTST